MESNTSSVDASFDVEAFGMLATEMYCSMDVTNGHIQKAWGGWAKLIGLSDVEIQSLPIYSFIHPDDVDAMRMALETITEARETGRFACRLRTQDGTYLDIEWTAKAGKLPGQVHAAGRDVTDLIAAKNAAQIQEDRIAQVAKGAPIVISVYNREGTFLAHVGAGLEKLGLKQNQLLGMSVFDAFRGADDALAYIRGALDGQEAANTQDLGTTIWDNWFSPTRNAEGEITGAMSISTDVTDRERSRQALEERLRVIEEQGRAIRVMSAPIIEVWQGILVVPVVGQLDEASAADMMERLLSTVVARGATFAILDLTAVDHVEPSTAEHLLRMVHALGLLGTQGLLSGIRPSVARALIELGIDLGKVRSVASLHAALRACMGSTRERVGQKAPDVGRR